MKTTKTTAFALALLFATGAAAEPTGRADAQYLQRISPQYSALAGSGENLRNLTSGLRTGEAITMVDAHGERFTFQPPTGPMGYGSITRALDLASRQLASQGISNPTPQQLEASLMGGTIRTADGPVTLQGILQLRSDGMGWGKIAQTVGVFPSAHASGTALQRATPGAARSTSPAPARAAASTTAHASHGTITTPLGPSGAGLAATRSADSRTSNPSFQANLARGADAIGHGSGGIGNAGGGMGHGGGASSSPGAGRGR